MTKRTPTDGVSRPTSRDRLPDPDDSDVFDEALVPESDAVGNQAAGKPDITYDPSWSRGNDDLDAVPSPPGTASPMADPSPATPTVETAALESSGSAGSGGGAGRPHVRPDASEKMLAAAMGVVSPMPEPGYQIRHAEEFARVLMVGAVVGSWVQALTDGRLVDDHDLRFVYAKVRQMAATRGLDLDDEGGIVSANQWIVAVVFAVIALMRLGYGLTKITDELAGIREELAHLRRMVP